MELARSAYSSGDVAASAAAHRVKAASSPEQHGGSGSEYIKSIVFGGLDGIITTFAIIASVAGAKLGLGVTLVTSIGKLLGDGLAMAIGDTISESAENSFIRGERQREAWEYGNYPEGEIKEMVEIYKKKGFSEEEASAAMHHLTRKPEYTNYFIDHMMVQELDLVVPDADAAPWKNGLVTLISFLFFGFVPIIGYCIFFAVGYENVRGQIGITAGVTVATLFVLGALQAKLLRQNYFKQGLLMALNGSIAAASAYGIGVGLEHALNLESEGAC